MMENFNIKFDGLEALINKMNTERPMMPVYDFKGREGLVLDKIKENTEDIYDSSKNQFWKNLLASVIGGTICGIISYLLTLL